MTLFLYMFKSMYTIYSTWNVDMLSVEYCSVHHSH